MKDCVPNHILLVVYLNAVHLDAVQLLCARILCRLNCHFIIFYYLFLRSNCKQTAKTAQKTFYTTQTKRIPQRIPKNLIILYKERIHCLRSLTIPLMQSATSATSPMRNSLSVERIQHCIHIFWKGLSALHFYLHYSLWAHFVHLCNLGHSWDCMNPLLLMLHAKLKKRQVNT